MFLLLKIQGAVKINPEIITNRNQKENKELKKHKNREKQKLKSVD
ncbi:hypothetical protein ACQWF6_24425 [Salmonella enterica subsp. enterica serovar Infantis]